MRPWSAHSPSQNVKYTGIHFINKHDALTEIILVKYVNRSICLIDLFFFLRLVRQIELINKRSVRVPCHICLYHGDFGWCRPMKSYKCSACWIFCDAILKLNAHDWGFESYECRRHFLHSSLSHLGQKAKTVFFRWKFTGSVFMCAKTREREILIHHWPSEIGRDSQIFLNSQQTKQVEHT